MRRLGTAMMAFGTMLSWSATASASCTIKPLATLDVSQDHGLPVVQGEINGHPVSLIVNSGDFYSFLTRDAAREAALSVKTIPGGYEVREGTTLVNSGRAYLDKLKLSGRWTLEGVNFLVGGDYGGFSGSLGQNIFSRWDVEYDFGHGSVRLGTALDCLGGNPAYWAGSRQTMNLPIAAMEDLDLQVIGTVIVNGVKLRAIFSSASASEISPKAAKRLGLARNDGADVTLADVDIGGERLRGATLRVDQFSSRDDQDMVIGFDFFRANRIFVANRMRRMFFTYESGTVFGVVPDGAGADQH